MKRFADLFTALDQTTATNEKIKALADFFTHSGEDASLWAIALFVGKRPKRTIKTGQLKLWASELASLPEWLFEESYEVVGDLAETIALILPPPLEVKDYSLDYILKTLMELGKKDDEEKKNTITGFWQSLNSNERFIFNKLITGSFRIGVSQQLIIKALSKYTGVEEKKIAHRLMGDWKPESFSLQNYCLTKTCLTISPNLILSISLTSLNLRWKNLAIYKTGRSSGNTMASADKSSCATILYSYGRAAKNCLRINFPNLNYLRSNFRMVL